MALIKYRKISIQFDSSNYLLLLIFVTFLSNTTVAQENKEDYKEIDTVVAKLYTAISFTDGKGADAETLKEIHHERAMMGSISIKNLRIFSEEEFRDVNNEVFKKNNVLSFQEKEIRHQTLVYGGVATRFSTYEFEIKTKNKELKVKGVNIFQLVKDPEKGWLIFSNVFSDNMSYPDPKTN